MRQQKEERIIRKTPTLRTARKLIRISSPITREELQRLAAEQPPPVERPEGLAAERDTRSAECISVAAG